MARNVNIGDKVWIPYARVGDSPDAKIAYESPVHDKTGRTLVVNNPDPANPNAVNVATSAVHTCIGVCVVRIGDMQTEFTLLDPLAKSLLQYFRLMLPDDAVRLREIRSLAELDHFWQQEHALYSHIVLIGHADRNAIYFFTEGAVSGSVLAKHFAQQTTFPKHFISLCCESGRNPFARSFSCNTTACASFVAPFHSVHGALASQFCQCYHAHHLVDGRSSRIAFNRTRTGMPTQVKFRFWQAGRLMES